MRIFTIENTETGEFRTFRIETMPEDSNFAPGKIVLSLLSGPSNSNDYRGFGFVDAEGVTVWKRFRTEDGKGQYEGLAKLVSALLVHDAQSERYQVIDAIPCRRCSELLTVPESIRRGIGPVCARRE